MHEHLIKADLKNNSVTIGLDHQIIHQLDAAAAGRNFKLGVVMLVVDATEFNESFNELNAQSDH
jgi:hypothetical protein